MRESTARTVPGTVRTVDICSIKWKTYSWFKSERYSNFSRFRTQNHRIYGHSHSSVSCSMGSDGGGWDFEMHWMEPRSSSTSTSTLCLKWLRVKWIPHGISLFINDGVQVSTYSTVHVSSCIRSNDSKTKSSKAAKQHCSFHSLIYSKWKREMLLLKKWVFAPTHLLGPWTPAIWDLGIETCAAYYIWRNW